MLPPYLATISRGTLLSTPRVRTLEARRKLQTQAHIGTQFLGANGHAVKPEVFSTLRGPWHTPVAGCCSTCSVEQAANRNKLQSTPLPFFKNLRQRGNTPRRISYPIVQNHNRSRPQILFNQPFHVRHRRPHRIMRISTTQHASVPPLMRQPQLPRPRQPSRRTEKPQGSLPFSYCI